MKETLLQLTVAIVLCGSGKTLAQTTPDYMSVEGSLQLSFSQRNWSEVLKISRLALNHNIDYLALRQRAGIASFERGRFKQSAEHLYAAQAFYPSDSTTLTYLYYSLLLGGQPAEAISQGYLFPDVVRRQLGIRYRQLLTSVSLETGIKTSSIPAEVGNAWFTTLGLGQRLNPAVQIYHSLTQLTQTYGNDLHLNQWQYQLRSDLLLDAGWLLSPSLTVFSVKGSGTTITDLRQKGTAFHLNLTRSGLGWKVSPLITYSRVTNSISTTESVGANPTGSGADKQWQLGFGGEYTLNRVRVSGSYEWQQQTGQTTGWHTIWNLNAFFTPSPRFSLRAGYGYYNTTNFLESNTGIFNNVPDPTFDKTTLQINVGASRWASLFLLSQYERKRSLILSQNYHYITFSGGLTLSF
ncbi:hypothetical protein WBJ53_16610 [Spirosoma sp. SC4-14]|uniref:hypothetical protein n=1 Tax=Spirosoma sp. SC4-14 TaxID=3128900 RepID=UPI0030CC67C2